MAMTNYLESKLIDHIFGGVTFVPPTVLGLALFTADPTESGSLLNEVAVGSYARIDVTTSFDLNVDSAINNLLLAFPEPTAAWGDLTHIAVVDSLTGGNMLFYTTISRNIDVGDLFAILTGDLQILLD